MKNKGFTLVEVLAAITVIAVIALIATPVVNFTIKRMRKATFTRSADGLLKTTINYYIDNQTDLINARIVEFKCENNQCLPNVVDADLYEKLNYTGKLGHGKVTIDEDGLVAFDITNDVYCAYKFATKEKIYVDEGNCDSKHVIFDATKPKIEEKSKIATSNSILIGYQITEEESGIKEVICTYGSSLNSIEDNRVTSASETACKLDNLRSGTYYYKICAIDNGTNHSEPCVEGSATTTDIIKPDLAYKGYNKGNNEIDLDTIESFNQYVYKDSVIVSYDNTNVTGANNYIKVSINGKSNIDVNKSCGTGAEPVECTDIESTKNLTEEVWYKVDRNLIVELEEQGTLYTYTYDATGNKEHQTGTSRKVDRTGPTINLGEATTTPYTITIPITTMTDTESGNIKNRTCTYGTGESYDNGGTGVISVDKTKCTITGLDSSTDYNYRIYAEDGLGNSSKEEGSTRTKAAIAGTPVILASWPNPTSMTVTIEEGSMTIDESDTISYQYSIAPASRDITEEDIKQVWLANGDSYTFTGLTEGTEYKVLVETKATSGGDLGNINQSNIYTSKTVTSEQDGYSTQASCQSSSKTINADSIYNEIILNSPACTLYNTGVSCSKTTTSSSSCTSTTSCTNGGYTADITLQTSSGGRTCQCETHDHYYTSGYCSSSSSCDEYGCCSTTHYNSFSDECSIIRKVTHCWNSSYTCNYSGYLNVYKASYSGIVKPKQTRYEVTSS